MAITKPGTLICRFLTDDGTSSGAENINGDYSVTPGTFYAAPTAGKVWWINTAIIRIRDVTAQFSSTGYGAGAVLPTGLKFEAASGSVSSPTTLANFTPDLVRRNDDWGALADTKLITWTGPQDTLHIIYDFQKQLGSPVVLSGDSDQKLLVTVNDDLSFLSRHTFIIQGIRRGDT